MEAHDLLLEIGAEELPASFVEGALKALPELAKKRFAALRLTHGAIRPLGTPRRLALLVDDLAASQPDVEEDVLGPPISAAFDKEGKPTRAAEAFARKLGIATNELKTVETPKGKYLAGTRREKGKPTTELLGQALAELVREIPFRKSMRWADREETFGRPIRWIVALYGRDVVPFTFAGVRSDRTTFGHRFLAPEEIDVPSPDEYPALMANAHVLVEPAVRRARMLERLRKAAEDAGGTLIEDAFLMDENLSLVEEPYVVVGSFEERFLGLPEEVILEVARGHQRYFGVRSADGKLMPKYLAVVNTANRPDLIAKGNDRVMRARLSDAQFFFDEDRKVKLDARRPRLAGIVFHAKLGSVGQKVDRVVSLVPKLAKATGQDDATAKTATRGAELAKCDLVSLMVGEFPELQGVMGRAYALAQGEPAAVADVIRDHYLPKGGKDDVAKDAASSLVGLADRLDTLVGCFSVGLQPTGAADPYALRRACLGALRTLIARGWDVSTTELIGLARDELEAQGAKLDLGRDETIAKVADFTRERLRHHLAEELPSDVVDACIAVRADRPVDVKARAEALAGLPREVRAKVGEVFKRVANIAKEAPPGEPASPSEKEGSPHASEVELFEAYRGLAAKIEKAGAARDHAGAFGIIAHLAPKLEAYFTNVYVMTDDVAVRENRLRLMRAVRDACSAVAHIQLLQDTSAS